MLICDWGKDGHVIISVAFGRILLPIDTNPYLYRHKFNDIFLIAPDVLKWVHAYFISKYLQ